MKEKIKQGAEGLVITCIGIFLFVCSVNIKANPIKQSGWAGVLSQAKFIPIILSVGITALGIVLFLNQTKGKKASATLSKDEWLRMAVVVVVSAAYIFAVYKLKFLIPTILFAIVIFVYLNWKQRKPLYLAFFIVLAIVLGLWVMPLLINLTLPMM